MVWKMYPGNARPEGESEHQHSGPASVAGAKSGPLHTIKLGKVQATIWRNETKHGPRFNVTVNRLYLDGETWKRSDSFGRDELLTAAHVFVRAFDWIWSQGKASEEGAPEGSIGE